MPSKTAPKTPSSATAVAAAKNSTISGASVSSSTASLSALTKEAASAKTPPLIKRPNPTPTPSSAAKKRPYRRTKRPKNYCDKSTITTTTQAVHTPVNVYDAVLGECEDLLKASTEAQSLGRLKMASAYQLLLHTRLIGLGKRFDRAQTLAPTPNSKRRGNVDNAVEDNDIDTEESRFPTSRLNYDDQLSEKPSAEAKGKGGDSAPNSSETPRNSAISADSSTTSNSIPRALQQLTSILPSNLEMDTTMMEHLARAAVELHHQRTGRKKSADGLLASPMTGGFPATPQPESTTPKGAGSKLAWTVEEQKTVTKALQQKKSAPAIAKLLPSKTEAQVKAFLKNRKAKDSVQDAFQGDETPSKRKGGRGRKPPTTAMNTVPNANLDMKALLQGQGLRKGQASGAKQRAGDVVIL
ncbi:unnamed protein product [Cylindrotheca closterium]|uniref:Myb-like domain-containing protein n=1 Tax=Cylindrotheca closterium TaxID=2856 RepID=A0AAD2FPC0_9STRA|nr:unnamed protein product [Cylindrotheca closterium]